MGCSLYFAITGAQPVIPLDIIEATYLQPPPDSILSTTNLIAQWAITLQKCSEDLSKLYSKVYKARRKAAIRFEKTHTRTIRNFNFKRGDLVLIHNTVIEKALNRKMWPQYLGPLVVVSHNFGGTYIISELDGSVLHHPIAAFRVIPYFTRKSIPIPENFINIDSTRLQELEQTTDINDDENPSTNDTEDTISEDKEE